MKVNVYQVLGEDSNKPAQSGDIAFDIMNFPGKKPYIVLTIHDQEGKAIASTIITINQMNDLVNVATDSLLEAMKIAGKG